MAETNEIVHVSEHSGVKVVRLRASAIREEREVEALGRELLALAEEPGQRIVLSFLGVKHLTSLALGTLIQVHKRLTESGGEIRLADIHPQIYEVFRITHLEKLFKVYEHEREALASFLSDAER
ncbi:MAG: STAS domain-containing protein [Phycisphaerae bacterium]